jgi:ATP-dependent DNA helicase RecG
MSLTNRTFDINLGRLKYAGLSEAWHVPLYLPTGFMDCRNIIEDFSSITNFNQDAVFIGKYSGDLQTEWKRNRNGRKSVPFNKGSIKDFNDRKVNFSFFGEVKSFKAALEASSERVIVKAAISNVGGRTYLNNPILLEEHYLNKLVPIYPGVAGRLSPENARKLILELLPATIDIASERLREILTDIIPAKKIREILQCPLMTLDEVLYMAHYPSSEEDAYEAHKVLERLAAIISVSHLRSAAKLPIIKRPQILYPDWLELVKNVPFQLTQEQLDGIEHLMNAFAQPHTTTTLINGDVGMGKSVIYQVAVIAAVKAGSRVAILLPNERLAIQAYEEINSMWPDAQALLVNKKTKKNLTDQNLLVGTTALLFREIGHLDVCVTDEQHRFSVEQRKFLANDKTHLIELSATPIPRTQAMLSYGSMNVIKLTKRHCVQDIHTFIVNRDGAKDMVLHVKELIESGSSLLIVCPRKEQKVDLEDDEVVIPSVQEVAAKWEKLFPGKVRIMHSDTPEVEARQSLDDIKSGKASIMVSTTVLEVGLTINGLRALVIVHAERFGVAQLHQLRGRLSRHGGYGVCYLYIPVHVKDHTMERLNAVAATNDGLKLSELDMKLRGFGDLSAKGAKQHGSADSVIFNKEVSVELLQEMIELLPEEID